jgi:hypothetical protein
VRNRNGSGGWSAMVRGAAREREQSAGSPPTRACEEQPPTFACEEILRCPVEWQRAVR